MIAHSYLASDYRIILDHGAATDAGLCGNNDTLANIYIVGDLNQVIDFGAAADTRSAQRTTVYTGVGPNFDNIFEHDRADLREL
jgi:hypothetical protein